MKSYTVSYFSYFRAFLGSAFLLIGIFLLLSLGYREVGLFNKRSEASLLIIDRSLSMAVEDVHSLPAIRSRLDLAKHRILTSLGQEKKVGVITFAKNPTLVLPLSQADNQFNDIIESITPESDVGGSDLPLALQFAINLYGEKTLSISVFTDGGSTSSSELPKIPKNWRVTIYGIGSEIGGKIPLGYNANGERRYKYFSGSEVIVAYEKGKLEALSKAMGTNLIHLDGTSQGSENAFFHFFLDNLSYTFASIFLLIGILVHPYGRKKINI